MKDAVGKDTAAMTTTDSVTDRTVKEDTKSSSVEKSLTAEAGDTSVDEYKAKMAERRRLAREKAELEATQEEERQRQQLWVD